MGKLNHWILCHRFHPNTVSRGLADEEDMKLIARFLLIRYGSWLRERSRLSLHDSDILDQPETPIDPSLTGEGVSAGV